MDWIHLAQGMVQWGGSFNHGNKLSASIKAQECRHYLKNSHPDKKHSAIG
jgi:hypothetical protein